MTDSVKRFGLVDPIIVNTHPERRNIIIGGHQRIVVAKELGIKEVPCVEVNLARDRERELNIRLNKNTGEWDWEMLGDLFEESELLDWGFDEGELEALFQGEIIEERTEELKPYNMSHVLISFPPDMAIEAKPLIDAISQIEGVELEQSAN